MRLIIAGGRDFCRLTVGNRDKFIPPTYQWDAMRMAINEAVFKSGWGIAEITQVVCGMAQGADLGGRRWAIERKIPVAEFPANWKAHGKSAGYKRNVDMAANADALIAFWDGKSRGTMHMINIARDMGLKVFVKMY